MRSDRIQSDPKSPEALDHIIGTPRALETVMENIKYGVWRCCDWYRDDNGRICRYATIAEAAIAARFLAHECQRPTHNGMRCIGQPFVAEVTASAT